MSAFFPAHPFNYLYGRVEWVEQVSGNNYYSKWATSVDDHSFRSTKTNSKIFSTEICVKRRTRSRDAGTRAKRV